LYYICTYKFNYIMGKVKKVGETSITIIAEGQEPREVKVGATYKKVSTEPPFVKMYVEDLGKLKGVAGGDIVVFLALLKFVGYDNIFDANLRNKEALQKELDYKTIQAITNSLSRLKGHGLIIPMQRGSFLINPEYITKKNWDETQKIIMVVHYEKDGSKRIKSEFITNPQEVMDMLQEAGKEFDNE